MIVDQVLKMGISDDKLIDFSEYVHNVDIRARMKRYQRTFSFSVMLENSSAVHSFLNGKLGTEVFFEYGPGGIATGQAKQTGSVILNSIQGITSSTFINITGVPASDLTTGRYK